MAFESSISLFAKGQKREAMYRSLVTHVKKGQKTRERSETPNRWFMLPREIRDEIYFQVLCKRYLIHWPARWKQGKRVYHDDRPLFWFRGRLFSWRGWAWSGHIGTVKRPLYWADIALLLTSKAISQEAIEIMYKWSSFSVYVGMRSVRWYRMTPLPPQQLLSRMQNLIVGTCVCDTLDYTASEKWLKSFHGNDVQRRYCRISFPCYYCLVWCTDHTPFYKACQSLVGFDTVIITLEQLCGDAEDEEELSELYNSMREDFQTALEPHLGPGLSYGAENCFCLRFHPRKHLENVRADRSKSGAQALVLEEDKASNSIKKIIDGRGR